MEAVEMEFWQQGNNVILIYPTQCVALQGADFKHQHWSAGKVQVCVMWLKPAQEPVQPVLLMCSNLLQQCVALLQEYVIQQRPAQVPLWPVPPTYL